VKVAVLRQIQHYNAPQLKQAILMYLKYIRLLNFSSSLLYSDHCIFL